MGWPVASAEYLALARRVVADRAAMV